MRFFQRTFLAAALLVFASTSLFGQYTTPISFWLSPQFTAPTAMSAHDHHQITTHYQKQALAGNIGARSMILSGQVGLASAQNIQFGTLGLNLIRQESGSSYLFATTGAMLSYNYTASITSQHHLVGGIQGGYFSRRIDWSKVRTGSQFGEGQLNPQLDPGERYNDYKSSTITANIGLAYYLTDARGEQRLHLGAGMINANKGRFTYLENDDNQAEPVKWIVYSHLRLISNPFYELGTNMYWQQESRFNDFVGGLQLNKGINPRKTVAEEHLGLGVYYSPDRSATLAMQLVRQNLLLGISYSLPFGNANVRNIQNAAEVTLGWRMQRTDRKRSFHGSSFRGKAPVFKAKNSPSARAKKRAATYKLKGKRNTAKAYNANSNKKIGAARGKKFSKKVSSYKSKARRLKPSGKNKLTKKSAFSKKYRKAYKKAKRASRKSKQIRKWKPANRWFQR